MPLAIVISGANSHDVKLLEQTLDAIVIAHPATAVGTTQHLCADAGYAGKRAAAIMAERGYIPHVRSRGQEIVEKQDGKQARRWVVEVTFSWFNRFRKLLIRWEKKDQNYMALLQFACAIIVWRKVIPVHQ